MGRASTWSEKIEVKQNINFKSILPSLLCSVWNVDVWCTDIVWCGVAKWSLMRCGAPPCTRCTTLHQVHHPAPGAPGTPLHSKTPATKDNELSLKNYMCEIWPSHVFFTLRQVISWSKLTYKIKKVWGSNLIIKHTMCYFCFIIFGSWFSSVWPIVGQGCGAGWLTRYLIWTRSTDFDSWGDFSGKTMIRDR